MTDTEWDALVAEEIMETDLLKRAKSVLGVLDSQLNKGNPDDRWLWEQCNQLAFDIYHHLRVRRLTQEKQED